MPTLPEQAFALNTKKTMSTVCIKCILLFLFWIKKYIHIAVGKIISKSV